MFYFPSSNRWLVMQPKSSSPRCRISSVHLNNYANFWMAWNQSKNPSPFGQPIRINGKKIVSNLQLAFSCLLCSANWNLFSCQIVTISSWKRCNYFKLAWEKMWIPCVLCPFVYMTWRGVNDQTDVNVLCYIYKARKWKQSY